MNHIRQGDAFIETRGKSRPGRLGQQPLPAGLVNNLEELRGCVLRRLESIEELARRCSDGPSIEITRTEQMLKQRIKELELERSRTCSDAALDQPVDKQLLTQLENDRQLLADAWERLERERIDALGRGPAQDRRNRFNIPTRLRGRRPMVRRCRDSRRGPRPPTPSRNRFSASSKRSVATSAAPRMLVVPRTEKVPIHANESLTPSETPQEFRSRPRRPPRESQLVVAEALARAGCSLTRLAQSGQAISGKTARKTAGQRKQRPGRAARQRAWRQRFRDAQTVDRARSLRLCAPEGSHRADY